MIQRIRQWARLAGRDVYAVYRAARDPRVPWYAKALAFCVAGYALSPIDLIPDFVPAGLMPLARAGTSQMVLSPSACRGFDDQT